MYFINPGKALALIRLCYISQHIFNFLSPGDNLAFHDKSSWFSHNVTYMRRKDDQIRVSNSVGLLWKLEIGVLMWGSDVSTGTFFY